MRIPITIGDLSFPSKDAATAHCKEILYRGELGSEITGSDADFVEALLYARPDKVTGMAGRTVVRYLRKMHPYNTPCFCAELDDGSLLDFSYMKFIKAYPRATAA